MQERDDKEQKTNVPAPENGGAERETGASAEQRERPDLPESGEENAGSAVSGLGTAPVGKMVAKLAVPAVLAQLINLLYNLVDRMYVGGIPAIGTDALAGLGVVFPITLIVSAFSSLVGMGVRGAALATVLSQGISALWVTLFFFRKKSQFRFRRQYFFPQAKTVGRMLLLGLSPFIMSVTESAIQIVFNVNLRIYSEGNSDYTAALTIMLSAVQMVCLPLNGLGTGVQPLVSYNYGCGNSARIRKTIKIVAVIALCGSASIWLLSILAPQVYGYMFSASESVMELVKKYTPFFMMGTVMFFAQMTLQNVFVALNQAKISIFLACLRKVILLIPLCFLLPLAFGVSGVFYSEGIADILAGIVTAATFFTAVPRILRRRERELARRQE